MEAQGWGIENGNGYFLTPYAGDAQLGVVFSDQEPLEGWFEADSEAAARLVPFAEIAGDGSTGALWLDDQGTVKVVALTSLGTFVLADSAVDFLRLVAVGYHELLEFNLGDEPDEPEGVEAVAEFRAWVESTFDVEVPNAWPAVDTGDAFARWVGVQLGEEPEPAPVVPDGLASDAVTGDAALAIASLGRADGAEHLAAGLGLADGSSRTLESAGLEIKVHGGVVETIWVHVEEYAHPDRLVDGVVAAEASVESILARFGPPERQGEWQGEQWVRYTVGGRYLRLGLDPERGLVQLTFMVTAP